MLRLLAATLAIGAARATDDAPAAAVADGPHPCVLSFADQAQNALAEAVASVDQCTLSDADSVDRYTEGLNAMPPTSNADTALKHFRRKTPAAEVINKANVLLDARTPLEPEDSLFVQAMAGREPDACWWDIEFCPASLRSSNLRDLLTPAPDAGRAATPCRARSARRARRISPRPSSPCPCSEARSK